MHTQESALIKAMDTIMGSQVAADDMARMDETFHQIGTARDWIMSTNQECQQPCDYLEVLEIIGQLEDKLLGNARFERKHVSPYAEAYVTLLLEAPQGVNDVARQ